MKKDKYTEESVKNLPTYKAALKDMNNELRLLEKSRDMMASRINDIEHITEFYKGVPLGMIPPHPDDCTQSFSINTIPDREREANIYHNANKPNSEDNWGIYIYDYSQTDTFKIERWLGTGHKKEDAIQIAKDWVVFGKVPP